MLLSPWLLPITPESDASSCYLADRIPDTSPWFNGHFPNNPVFPGLAILAQVHSALQKHLIAQSRQLQTGGLARVRFKRVVRPDERLQIRFNKLTENKEAFEVKVNDECCGYGQWLLHHHTDLPVAPVSLWSDDRPSKLDGLGIETARLLPHGKAIRLARHLSAADSKGGIVQACVENSWPMHENGVVPCLTLIELVAQAVGMWAIWRNRADGITKRQGYLVGLRFAHFYVENLPVGADLAVSVRLVSEIRNYLVFEVLIHHGHEVCFHAEVQVAEAEESEINEKAE